MRGSDFFYLLIPVVYIVIRLFACMPVYLNVYLYMCVCVCASTFVYVCMCKSARVFMMLYLRLCPNLKSYFLLISQISFINQWLLQSYTVFPFSTSYFSADILECYQSIYRSTRLFSGLRRASCTTKNPNCFQGAFNKFLVPSDFLHFIHKFSVHKFVAIFSEVVFLDLVAETSKRFVAFVSMLTGDGFVDLINVI